MLLDLTRNTSPNYEIFSCKNNTNINKPEFNQTSSYQETWEIDNNKVKPEEAIKSTM